MDSVILEMLMILCFFFFRSAKCINGEREIHHQHLPIQVTWVLTLNWAQCYLLSIESGSFLSAPKLLSFTQL